MKDDAEHRPVDLYGGRLMDSIDATEDDTIHALLRYSCGRTFRFVFTDGEEMTAEVVSDSHVDADDNIWVVRVNAGPQENGWQLRFAEIKSIAEPDGRALYEQS